MNRKDTIIAEIKQRNIQYLLHFTPAPNILSIIEHGIYSRDAMPDEIRQKGYWLSSLERLNENDAVTSVSLMSYWPKMFAAKCANGEQVDYVFLMLDPDILWDLECHFYPSGSHTNYAKRGFRNFGSTTLFLEMFEDRDPYGLDTTPSYRRSNGIPSFFPTDPATEIHVCDHIPSERIIGAFVPDIELANRLRPEFDKLPGNRRSLLVADHWEFRVGDRVNAQKTWGYLERALIKDPEVERERRALYEEFAHESGQPAYLMDGTVIYPPDD